MLNFTHLSACFPPLGKLCWHGLGSSLGYLIKNKQTNKQQQQKNKSKTTKKATVVVVRTNLFEVLALRSLTRSKSAGILSSVGNLRRIIPIPCGVAATWCNTSSRHCYQKALFDRTVILLRSLEGGESIHNIHVVGVIAVGVSAVDLNIESISRPHITAANLPICPRSS